MIHFYDKNFDIVSSDPIHAIINGLRGGASDILVYVRNDDESVYYTDMLIALDSTDGVTGYLSDDGIYVKFLAGQATPTEREWDLVLPAESIPFDDIGDFEAADTFTYHPFWIRVFIPGESPARYLDFGKIKLYYTEIKVTGV